MVFFYPEIVNEELVIKHQDSSFSIPTTTSLENTVETCIRYIYIDIGYMECSNNNTSKMQLNFLGSDEQMKSIEIEAKKPPNNIPAFLHEFSSKFIFK